MSGHGPTDLADLVRRWFRRDVEDRLRDIVGGPARLRVVVLLACVLALVSADTSTIGAIAAQLERSLHIGNTDIGLLVTASTGIAAVATLPLGALVDRINRTGLLAAAILLWSVAMAVSGVAGSYPMLLITRLALGAVVATAGPAVASLTGDLFPAAERGRIYGFILSGELIGAGAGLLVSGDVAAALSWRYAFWLLALLGAALAAAIWRRLPEPARGGQSRLPVGAEEIRTAEQVGQHPAEDAAAGGPDAEREGRVEQAVEEAGVRPHERLVLHDDPAKGSLWWAVRYVLSIRTNVVLIISSALGYFFFAGLQTFAVVFMRGRFGLAQGVATALLVVIGAGALIGVLVTGRLADRLIRRHHLAARPVVAGVSFLFAAALFLPGLLTTFLPLALPLVFLAAAGVGGANPPLDAARLDLIHSRLWGRAEAVRTVLRTAAVAAAPLLFGFVSDQFGAHTGGLGNPTGDGGPHAIGLDYTFLIMLGPLLAAGLLLLLFARRTYPRDVATAVASEHATRAPADGSAPSP